MRTRAQVIGLLSLVLVAGLVAAQDRTQAPSTPTPKDELRIVLVGQALIHQDLRTTLPASVAQAREYLGGADVAFTNLETAVAPVGAAVTPRSPTARHSTPDVLDCLRDMGFNLLSLANNHAADLRESGIAVTRQEVARKGFAYAGTGGNAAEAAAAGYLDTPAGRVALVAFAGGASQLTPNTWAGPDRPGVNYLDLRPDGTLDPEQKGRVLDAVRLAGKQARLVVAYMHSHYWGERRGVDGPPGRDPRVDRFTTPEWMEHWARELVDAGAGLFVAHGNPALHGVEIYKGRLILYGLGNYIFHSIGNYDTYGPLTYFSAAVHASVGRNNTVTAVRFTPLVLAMNGQSRGAPFIAQGGEALAVLNRLAELSRSHGTEIRIERERAEVVLK